MVTVRLTPRSAAGARAGLAKAEALNQPMGADAAQAARPRDAQAPMPAPVVKGERASPVRPGFQVLAGPLTSGLTLTLPYFNIKAQICSVAARLCAPASNTGSRLHAQRMTP